MSKSSLNEKIEMQYRMFDVLGHYDIQHKIEAQKGRDHLLDKIDEIKNTQIQSIKMKQKLQNHILNVF